MTAQRYRVKVKPRSRTSAFLQAVTIKSGTSGRQKVHDREIAGRTAFR